MSWKDGQIKGTEENYISMPGYNYFMTAGARIKVPQTPFNKFLYCPRSITKHHLSS